MASDKPAPVRLGSVTFTGPAGAVTDIAPDIEMRDNLPVAVYRATLSGDVTATGRDVWGNTSP